jgi:hypothetical protein
MVNPWLEHVKKYAKSKGISYKDAISKARPSYKPKGGSKTKMKKQSSSDKTNEKQGMEIKALKKSRGRPKKVTVELDDKKVSFKEGGLRKALKVGEEHKFKKGELRKANKTEVGESFEFHGKKHKMTSKLKKQITLALNLMK